MGEVPGEEIEQTISQINKVNDEVWMAIRHPLEMIDPKRVKSVLSVTEAISEGAEEILLEALLEGMAEYYSVDLAEKTLRGMAEHALACKVNASGILP